VRGRRLEYALRRDQGQEIVKDEDGRRKTGSDAIGLDTEGDSQHMQCILCGRLRDERSANMVKGKSDRTNMIYIYIRKGTEKKKKKSNNNEKRKIRGYGREGRGGEKEEGREREIDREREIEREKERRERGGRERLYDMVDLWILQYDMISDTL
jgi:hypothetical protein